MHFSFLAANANKFIGEMIVEFKIEKNHGLKCWLLELIGESKSPKSFDILKDNLQNENESLRDWAILGLKNLNTKEARRLLFESDIKNTNYGTSRNN